MLWFMGIILYGNSVNIKIFEHLKYCLFDYLTILVISNQSHVGALEMGLIILG